MNASLQTLPNDVDELKDLVRGLQLELRLKEEMIRLMRIQKYGPKSEKLNDGQLSLLEEEPGVKQEEVHSEAAHAGKRSVPIQRNPKPGRVKLPAHLPRVLEPVSCSPEQCRCEQCGAATHVIGHEESEVLEVEPAKYFVRVIKREKRACQHCPEQGVLCARSPDRIVEKGKLSDTLIVDAVLKKYRDHLPLYRQSQSLLADAGIEIHRSSLCVNVMKVGDLCAAITRAMKAQLFAQGYIQADETPVGVQSDRTQGKNHQGYIFQYSHPRGVTIFQFRSGRSREGPRKFLEGFRGLLQTDGYTGYDKLGGETIERIGCMAHIRRKFHDAHKAAKQDPQPKEIIECIGQLYEIEEQARQANLDAEQRKKLRQEKSEPLMQSLQERILELRQSPNVTPASLMGKACNYALNQWERSARYLNHGEVEIDNNRCENGIRPIALGRKNWLHIGSEEAGPKVAGIMSIIETCRRLEINPREYLLDVLPGLAERDQSEIAELTPTAWKARKASSQ